MKFVTILVLLAVFALCWSSTADAQSDCKELEFDVYNIVNGSTMLQLFQLATLVNDNEGVSFGGQNIPITLPIAITNGQVQFQIILSPDVGVINGTVMSTVNPNTIQLALNGEIHVEQYNPFR